MWRGDLEGNEVEVKTLYCVLEITAWAVNGTADSSDDTVMLRCGWYSTLCEQNLAHNPQIWRWSRNTAIFCGPRLILNGLKQSGKRFYGQTHYFEIRPIKFQIEMWTSCYQLSVSAAGILYYKNRTAFPVQKPAAGFFSLQAFTDCC